MSQATLSNLFGDNASYNQSTGILTIDLDDLADEVGLIPGQAQPLELYAAIVVFGADWLRNNADDSLMAEAAITAFDPVVRNELERTQFSAVINFYTSYSSPIFSADDLVS